MKNTPEKLLALALALAVGCGAAGLCAQAADAPAHDLYLCAAINKNYVVGSKFTTDSGILKRDAAGQYKLIGPNFPFFFNLSFDPRDHDVIYAATLNGCLRTADGGKSWRTGTGWDMTEPKDVFVDPNAPDTIYLALPDGIAVSTDCGATWPRCENGLPARGKYTQVVKVDRTKAGRALAGCESGIYLTDNAAKNWRRVFKSTTTITDIRQSPHDPKLWLASTQADGALVSRDGGLTWKKFDGVPSADALYNVAFDATNPLRYAIGSWTYGVLTTEDGGKTWTERNDGLPEDHCVFRVGIDPDNGRLYAAVYKDTLFSSDDFGRTWRKDNLEGATVYNFVFLPKAAAAK